MGNQVRSKNSSVGITFPPTSTVRIDDLTIQRLRKEGLEIRRSIERSAASMFAVSSPDSSTRMR
jgi:hypothetical protein